ncbi:MAG: DUF2852 domain-containing protein [Paracoccaceae bacterium]|nr:DUF2852 domain-containing protein [Paracoccaceae bacterium]MDE2914607.1 DUF2852 domain-containing protein [Paracoccaceae bacterium]
MSTPVQWLKSAERCLDEFGWPAWITAMVIGYVAFWPIGLAITFYMIWSQRMTRSFFSCKRSRTFRKSSGNTAFDAYKTETLKRLEDEQKAFRKFLQRLRDAKDRSEFEQFLAERNASNSTSS